MYVFFYTVRIRSSDCQLVNSQTSLPVRICLFDIKIFIAWRMKQNLPSSIIKQVGKIILACNIFSTIFPQFYRDCSSPPKINYCFSQETHKIDCDQSPSDCKFVFYLPFVIIRADLALEDGKLFKRLLLFPAYHFNASKKKFHYQIINV